MKHYSHKDIQQLLGISQITSYRWFPATRGGLISDRTILDALNARRRNGQPILRSVPDRLYRTDALAEWLTANTPRKRTAEACRRFADLNAAPHFKMSRLTIYHLPTVLAWMDEPRQPMRKSSLDGVDN